MAETMAFPCPNCGRAVKARSDRAGPTIRCIGCGKMVFLPAAESPSVERASVAEAEASAAPPSKTCPYCERTVPVAALVCLHCRESIRDETASDAPQVRERVRSARAALAGIADEIDAPSDLAGQPARFGRTSIAFPVAAAFIAACVVLSFRESMEAVLGLVVAAVGAFVSGAVLIWQFLAELSIPAVRDRGTPEQAILCYLKAVRHAHWKKAWECLSPWARGERDPDFLREDTILADAAALEAYWGELGSISDVSARPMDADERIARFEVTFRVDSGEASPFWVRFLFGWLGRLTFELTKERNEVTFDMVVYRHRSQWWVFTGLRGSRLDRCLTIDGPA